MHVRACAREEAERMQIARRVMQRRTEEQTQAARQRNTVTLMRTYRTGELPDIKISMAELLQPLGLLVPRDAVVAR